MGSLDGRVAIVTGSSRGIGEAIARAFSAAGASLIISSGDEAACRKVAGEIKAGGGIADAVRCDVSDEDEVRALVGTAVKRFGKLDIMVNNAGVYMPKPLDETDGKLWQRTISVNLGGAFYGTKHAASEMKKRKYGRIINLGSFMGVRGSRNCAAYAASKAGIGGLVRCAAVELAAHGITVNTLCPGPIESRMTEAFMRHKKSLKGRLVLGFEQKIRGELGPRDMMRIGVPNDVANAALFLAGDEAGFVTGTEIVVDGGWLSQL